MTLHIVFLLRLNVYNLVCFTVIEKKISEKEVAIQGSQSWLSFKLLPKDKELIISLTEMLAFYLK